MEHLVITDLKSPAEIEKRLNHFKQQMPGDLGTPGQTRSFALIIDGGTLGILFGANLDEPFRQITMQCDAVLCCRMSPAQKAQVVKLVKLSKNKPMTCAIGDGANDVSMIQEAHVGLGIYGKEGRNAALSADFAFAKFKFTKRILLVHGYLYYTRAANLVQYFFYKNLAFVICQFYYAFFNAFSSSSLYDSIVLTMYNIFFTAAPIFLFGLSEQKVAVDKIESKPYLYMTIKQNKLLTGLEFLRWNLQAIWHSLVAFFFAYGIYSSSTPFSSDGKLAGNVQFGGFIISLIIFIVHVKLLTEWQHKSVYLLFGYFLSVIGYIIFALLPNSFVMPEIISTFTDSQTNSYWIYYNLYSHGPVWFSIILIIVTAMLPDIVFLLIRYLRDADKMKKAQEREEEQIRQAKIRQFSSKQKQNERNPDKDSNSFINNYPNNQSNTQFFVAQQRDQVPAQNSQFFAAQPARPRSKRSSRKNSANSVRIFDAPSMRINTKVYQTQF